MVALFPYNSGPAPVSDIISPTFHLSTSDGASASRSSLTQVNTCTGGILIQYFIQYGSSFVDGGAKNPSQGTAAFRIPWGIQAVPGAILFIGLFFFPRSPRWLASKDRWEEALSVLAHLHGGGDMSHPKVLAEYKEIEDALRFEREVAETSFAALIKPRILKRVILGMSVQAWSQLVRLSTQSSHISLTEVVWHEHHDVLHSFVSKKRTVDSM